MPETYLYGVRRRWWVLLVVLLVIILIFVLTRGMSNSALITEVANEATRKAATDARVIALLGEGLTMSGQHSGQVSRDGISVVVPVTGSRGSGKLYATGTVADEHATLSSLAVAAGAERIDIPVGAR
ncbi:MAG TPA: cytochrome c oxidase assembly factor Coa1 family protein [Thermoanaerobaculia bacterium]